MKPNEAKVGDTIRVVKPSSKLNVDTETHHYTITKRTNFRKKGNYRLYLQHEHGWGCAVVIQFADESWPEQWLQVDKVEP